jgi:phosphohistidine phosphatase SixA
VTTLLIVRHADVDLPPTGDDPPLDAAGRARARALLHAVGSSGVDAVIASSLARTQQTVAPLTTRLGLTTTVLDDPGEEAAALGAGDRGSVVVVAGHSNTVPSLIAALGAGKVEIGETEFDNLFVVTTTDTGATLVHLRYGAP